MFHAVNEMIMEDIGYCKLVESFIFIYDCFGILKEAVGKTIILSLFCVSRIKTTNVMPNIMLGLHHQVSVSQSKSTCKYLFWIHSLGLLVNSTKYPRKG